LKEGVFMDLCQNESGFIGCFKNIVFWKGGETEIRSDGESSGMLTLYLVDTIFILSILTFHCRPGRMVSYHLKQYWFKSNLYH